MFLVSLKPENFLNDGILKAEFSDGSSSLLISGYLPEGFDPVSRELTARDEEALAYAAACYRAEKSALRLIARAEQHSLGLTAKLERRGHDAAVARTVVSGLLDRNLLDDTRYAELWVRSRLSAKKALTPRWLFASLAKRGIKRVFSQKAMNTVLDEEAEFTLLLRYIKKAGTLNGKGVISLKKHLKNEGFSLAVIERYLNIF